MCAFRVRVCVCLRLCLCADPFLLSRSCSAGAENPAEAHYARLAVCEVTPISVFLYVRLPYLFVCVSVCVCLRLRVCRLTQAKADADVLGEDFWKVTRFRSQYGSDHSPFN